MGKAKKDNKKNGISISDTDTVSFRISQFEAPNNNTNSRGKKTYLDSFLINIKDSTKDRYPEIIEDEFDNILKFYFRQSFNEPEAKSKLFALMAKKKIAKAFKTVFKNDPDAVVKYRAFCSIIHNFIIIANSNNSKLKVDSEILNIYNDILQKIMTKPIKKLSKKAVIPARLSTTLLIIVPDPVYKFNLDIDVDRDIVTLNKMACIRTCTTMISALLNYVDKESELRIDDINFKNMFIHTITEYAIPYMICSIWLFKLFKPSTITEMGTKLAEWSLDMFERLTKDAQKGVLEMYLDRMANDSSTNDRLVSFNALDKEKYPKLFKRINKMDKANIDVSAFKL